MAVQLLEEWLLKSRQNSSKTTESSINSVKEPDIIFIGDSIVEYSSLWAPADGYNKDWSTAASGYKTDLLLVDTQMQAHLFGQALIRSLSW